MAKKSADAFRTISEVSDALDTPAHVLRFWESKFSQIKPVKRAGGRRYYRPDDIDLLNGIRTLLHEQGMTIKGAQKLLREKGVKHVSAIAPLSGDGKPTSKTAETLVAKEAKPVAPTPEPADSSDVQIDRPVVSTETPPESDLPSLEFGAPKADPSILALVAKQKTSDLHSAANQLAPIIAKLETLHERMRAG